jgi:hypothetical protein
MKFLPSFEAKDVKFYKIAHKPRVIGTVKYDPPLENNTSNLPIERFNQLSFSEREIGKMDFSKPNFNGGKVVMAYSRPKGVTFVLSSYTPFKGDKSFQIKAKYWCGMVRGHFEVVRLLGLDRSFKQCKCLNFSRNNRDLAETLAFPRLDKKSNAIEKRILFVLDEYLKTKNKTINKSLGLSLSLTLASYPAITSIISNEFKPPFLVIPKVASKHLRSGTFDEAIGKIFGFNGRKLKQLIYNRILKDQNLNVLGFGIFKGLVPLDYFYKLLEINFPYGGHFLNFDRTEFRYIFKNYNSKRILDLFIEYTKRTRYGGSLNDLLSITQKIKKHKSKFQLIWPEKPHSIDDIHDYVSCEFHKLEHELKTIENKETQEKLKDFQHEKLKIVFPKDTHEVISWGQKMHHCIGSYAESAANNQIVLLGVEKEGILKYNICIIGNKLTQFRGFANASPEKEDFEAISSFLKNKKIEVSVY